MTQINQQRKVSSCCGAEVEQTECFCPGSTDLKHDQLICKKCEKRCDSKPQDHIVEADKIVAELPVERTSEETRQTGSEWEMKLEKFYTIGYSFSTKNSMCLSCRDSVDETHYCPKPTKERPSFETIRNFIRDLLAAQKEEMESKNRQDNELLLGARLATSEEKKEFLNVSRENGITGVESGFKHVGLRETYDPIKNTYYCKYCHEQQDANDMSSICSAHPDNKSNNKQIIEAVGKREKELWNEFTKLKTMHEMEKNAIAAKTLEQFVVWSDERKKLKKAEFKREYGGKE